MVSYWFSKDLGDGVLVQEQLDRIRELFRDAYSDVKPPKELAVFIRHESEGRLHCRVIVYFSPASASVATKVNAAPCNKPTSANLVLLAGADESWAILFPESRC